MADVTTFLWILAAIGAVVLAIVLATVLSRLAGPGEPEALMPEESGSRYARDNVRAINPAAVLAFLLLVGGLTALVLVLSLR